MRIHLIWVGKTKEPWLRQGVDHYLNRLKHYLQVKVSEVRAWKKGAGTKASENLRNEGKALLKAIPSGAYVIAMDIKGKMLDSPGLAAMLTDLEDRGTRDLAIIIGGDQGLSPDVIAAADMRLSLSPMTFTHDMARLILAEQLYRACTIRAGQPYHH